MGAKTVWLLASILIISTLGCSTTQAGTAVPENMEVKSSLPQLHVIVKFEISSKDENNQKYLIGALKPEDLRYGQDYVCQGRHEQYRYMILIWRSSSALAARPHFTFMGGQIKEYGFTTIMSGTIAPPQFGEASDYQQAFSVFPIPHGLYVAVYTEERFLIEELKNAKNRSDTEIIPCVIKTRE